jgi:hypothetical protein
LTRSLHRRDALVVLLLNASRVLRRADRIAEGLALTLSSRHELRRARPEQDC